MHPLSKVHNGPRSAAAMEITGLRAISEEAMARTVGAARRSVLALLCAEPGTSVTIDLSLGSVMDDLDCNVTAEGPDPETTEELFTALRKALHPVMELAEIPAKAAARETHPASVRWWLQPGTAALAPMGLPGPAPRVQTFAADSWDAPADFDELAAAFLQHPGTSLTLTLAAGPRLNDRSQTISISACAGTPGGRLPLGLRAVLDRWIPGYNFARMPSIHGHPLHLTQRDAATLPFIPAAGKTPMPGFRTAGPAAIFVRPLPGPVDAAGIHIGTSVLASGSLTQVRLGARERLQHIHITGKTGTGKSTLLAALAHHAAAAGEGLLLLDPHGHLAERIGTELPESAAERTWMINAGDLENPVPLNTFAVEDPDLLELAIADLSEVFYALYDPARTGIIGPRFEQILGMSLRTLAALHGPRASFLDVPRLLTDDRFQREAIAAVQDPRVKAWWANDDRARRSNDYGEVVAWVCSKWERFIGTRAVRGTLCSGLDALDPATAMDNGHIVIINLSKGEIGEPAARLLGFLYLTRFWTAATRRKTDRPFTVIVDEAQSFLAGALPSMLSEGRKFGLSLTLAHQYLAQLPPTLSEALSGNTATSFAFRAGERDAELLRIRMGQALPSAAFTTLPDLSALCQRTAGPVAPEPHTVRITHNDHPPTRAGATLQAHLAAMLARTRYQLADPHREAIAQAIAAGAALPPSTPARRPPAVRDDKRRSPEGFLDEWLAKHQPTPQTATSTPEKTPQEQAQ